MTSQEPFQLPKDLEKNRFDGFSVGMRLEFMRAAVESLVNQLNSYNSAGESDTFTQCVRLSRLQYNTLSEYARNHELSPNQVLLASLAETLIRAGYSKTVFPGYSE